MPISRFSNAAFVPYSLSLGDKISAYLSCGISLGSMFICLILSACGGGTGSPNSTIPEQRQLTGRTSFVSSSTAPLIGRAAISFDPANRSDDVVIAMDAAATGQNVTSSTRTVTEGDIYRVLDAGKTLLNLNPYRGLQIVDLSNPVAPKMLGRVAMSGSPTEMYRLGDRVYVLMNSWSQYRTVQKEGKEVLDRFHGSALITVDIANRSAPKILASTPVDGYLGASRMSSGGGKSALYVTLQQYSGAGGEAMVKSFAIDAQGLLQEKTSLSLGSYVQAIQAVNERLMVASVDANAALTGAWRSRVSVIDISSPDGIMVKGNDVAVSGVVKQKNNMHIQGNIMRIVSSSSNNGWGFLVAAGELRRDPNPVFINNSFSEPAAITVTVSDVIAPVGSGSKSIATLAAPAVNNANTNHVETFNISDIAKPSALDHDTFGDGQQLYGTTFMADRAFFVTYLRKDPFHAFSITPDGVMQEESEFIVSGWNDFFMPVRANTRLIGVGHNDENNRRALAISLYDITNLKNAKPLIARAEIDLAYSSSEANWDDRAFTILDDATNVLAADGKTLETGLVLLPFTGWETTSNTYRSGVQIFSFSASTLTRRGSMDQETQVRRSFMGDSSKNIAVNLSSNELSLFSLANTDAPAKQASMNLAANYSQFVAFSNVGVRYLASDFGWWGNNSAAQRKDLVEVVALNDVDGNAALASITVPAGSKMFAVGGHLSLVSSELVKDIMRTTITTYDLSIPSSPRLLSNFVSDEILAANDYSLYYLGDCGFVRCRASVNTHVTVVGNALVFRSHTAQKSVAADGKSGLHFWSSDVFQVLTLDDFKHPALLPKISMAADEEGVDVIQNGSSLWINYRKLQTQLGQNGEQQSKYFVKELRLASPANPQWGKEINIPGQLMAIVGEQFYSLEYNQVGKNVEPSLHMLIIQDNLAYLQASTSLAGKYPTGLLADTSAIVLTSYDTTSYLTKMDIYTVPVKEFALQSSNELESGVDPKILRPGKLLVQDWYGLFLYDISQPKTPKVRAYFSATSWGGSLSVANKDIYLPANFYGIYQFNFDTVNLPAS